MILKWIEEVGWNMLLKCISNPSGAQPSFDGERSWRRRRRASAAWGSGTEDKKGKGSRKPAAGAGYSTLGSSG